MRAQGALPASAIPVLEAHLATCESCREYEARSARVDASLGAPTGGADWPRLREEFGKRLRRARRVPLVMAGWILGVSGAFSAVSWLLTGHAPSWQNLVESFVVTMLVIGCGVLVGMRRLRRMLDEPDPVAANRRALERSLKSSRHFSRWMPFYLFIGFVQVLSPYGRLEHGDRRGGSLLVVVILGLVASICAIIWQRRHTRRLARELAEMN
jgi:hypothetical protein